LLLIDGDECGGSLLILMSLGVTEGNNVGVESNEPDKNPLNIKLFKQTQSTLSYTDTY